MSDGHWNESANARAAGWREENRSEIPEHRLLTAVLRRAVIDYCTSVCVLDGGDWGRQSENWFFWSRLKTPMSFAWVCGELGLDPEAVRTRVKALKEGGTVTRSHNTSLSSYQRWMD